MANPVVVECVKNRITEVATNVTAGFMKPLERDGVSYRETYRMTGGSAPTSVAEFMQFQGTLEISASAAIDVYVIASSELKDGPFPVRVDT